MKEKTDFLSSHDLTSLSPLDEETVVCSLEARHKAGVYYVWAGLPLIAINPFQHIEGLYDADTADRYRKGSNSSLIDEPIPAHIYAVGQRACRDLRREMATKNQSIIVSGESGAGKTWTTKSLMQFIADSTEKSHPDVERAERVEQRILDSNPILEAFGNATTVRNDNSSRFGKYIQLQFDRAHQLTGAKIKTYLLEKTRVVHQAKGEKNFHIFYQMKSYCDSDESWSDGAFILNGLTQQTKLVECAQADAKKFLETIEAMRNVGIHDILQCEIFKILSAIKNLSMLEAVSDAEKPNEPCVISGKTNVERLCDLLELEPVALQEYIAFRRIIQGSRSELFMKPCSVDELVARRDCLAKLLYSRLFEWIVEFINTSIQSPDDLNFSFIGLLDVYGFESFQNNSLEQLCINYANEKLQQHFVSHFLRKQQDEYEKEGLDWSFKSFVDNRPCLDLIEGKFGLFSLLNEECRLSRKPDNKAFCDRLDSLLGENTHYSRGRNSGSFTIHHYADCVCYNVKGFVDKNKDCIPPELLELLSTSKNWFLLKLFEDTKLRNAEKTSSKRPAAVTVVSKFKSSLDSLMSTLRSSNIHYIRCIKPNSVCKPGVFDKQLVLSQLKACGVVETIKISAAGYPVRFSMREFHKRYSFVIKYLKPSLSISTLALRLGTPSVDSPQSPAKRRRRRGDHRYRLGRRDNTTYDHTRQLCRSILELACCQYDLDEDKENLSPKSSRDLGVMLGRTKIFFKEKQIEQLENIRAKCLSKCAFTIQCCWLRYKRHLVRKATAVVNIQKGIRCWLTRKQYLKIRRAVITLQRSVRIYLAKNIKHPHSPPFVGLDSTAETLEGPIAEPVELDQDVLPLSIPKIRHSQFFRTKQSHNSVTHYCLLPGQLPCRPIHCSSFLTLFGIVRNFTATDFWELLIYQTTHAECLKSKRRTEKELSSHRELSCSKGTLSVREIEQVPLFFHCRTTPLTNAYIRPAGNTPKETGFAGISSLITL